MEKLKKFIMTRFHWDILQETEDDIGLEEGEDAPVIVNL